MYYPLYKGHSLKPGDLSPWKSPMAQSLRTFQSTLGVSDASKFSAHYAVKFDDIVISVEKSAVLAMQKKNTRLEI